MATITAPGAGTCSRLYRPRVPRYTRRSMPHDPAASTSWETISQRLQQMLNAGTYTTWFGNAQALEQEEDRLVVTVPNEFTLSWIEGHFSSLLDAAAAEHE